MNVIRAKLGHSRPRSGATHPQTEVVVHAASDGIWARLLIKPAQFVVAALLLLCAILAGSVSSAALHGRTAPNADADRAAALIDATRGSPHTLRYGVDSLTAIDQVGGTASVIRASDGVMHIGVGSRLLTIAAAPGGGLQTLAQSDVLPGTVTDVALHDRFAYVLPDRHGLRIIDATGKGRLATVGSLDEAVLATGLAVVDGYAYIAARELGVWVVDVTDPTMPQEVMWLPISDGQGADIIAAGGSCIIAATSPTAGSSRLAFIDVADAHSPRELPQRIEFGHEVQELVVHGEVAYALVMYEGIYAIDVSNTSDLRMLGQIPTVESPDAIRALTIDDDSAFVVYSGESTLMLAKYDVFEPGNVHEETTLALSLRATPVHVDVAEGIIYVACDGVAVVDATDSAQMRETAFEWRIGNCRNVALATSYAYVSAWNGLWVVRLTGEKGAQVVGTFGVGEDFGSVAAVEGEVYVAGGRRGLLMVDASDGEMPVETGAFLPADMGRVEVVLVEKPYAYVAGSADRGGVQGQIVALDISDPTAVREVGRLETGLWPRVIRGSLIGGTVGEGVGFLDVANPAAMRESESVGAGWRTTGIAFDERGSAYVSTNRGRFGGGADQLHVIDVSDLAHVHVVSTLDLTGPLGDLDFAGGLVFVANVAGDGTAPGVHVVDVSNPAEPERVGFGELPLHGDAPDIRVAGSRLYAVGGAAGLVVAQLGGPERGWLAYLPAARAE